MSELAQYVKDRKAELRALRQPLEGLMQELVDWGAPDLDNIARVYGIGENRRQHLFDGTMEHAAEIFAATIVGLTANQSTAWGSLGTVDEDSLTPEEQDYLQRASRMTLNFMRRPAGKFYDHYYSAILDIAILGPGAVMVLPDDKNVVRFANRRASNLLLAENFNGEVDTVYSDDLTYTVRQLLEKERGDGWKLHPKVKEMAKEESKLNEKVKVIHAIEPNPERKGELGVDAMSYRSVWVDEENCFVMHRGGFQEFPAPVGRWKEGSNGYGRSPARKALADTKSLNASRKAMLYASEYQLSPSMQAHASNRSERADFSPGTMNYYQEKGGEWRPINSIGNLNISIEDMAQLRAQIREAFYINEFQVPGRKKGNPMTASEVEVREDNDIRQRIPNINRITGELQGPCFIRCYKIIERTGMLGPIPKRLVGRELMTVYDTPISRIARAEENRAIDEMTIYAEQVSRVDPKLALMFNGEEAMRAKRKILGAPVKLLREGEEYERAVQEFEAAQQAQAAAEMASKVGVNVNG